MPEKNLVAHFINGLADSLEIHPPSRKRKRKTEWIEIAETDGFILLHVRGKETVSQEIGIALMTCNLHKLSLNAQKNKVTKEK